jgi:hypothetical protein
VISALSLAISRAKSYGAKIVETTLILSLSAIVGLAPQAVKSETDTITASRIDTF